MSEAKETGKSKKYRLKEVRIRLSEGHPLYSDVPITTPDVAMDVMRKELSQYDREVLCVVNLNNKMQPINFNIVSMGSINSSIASIPNILKSGILSNAYGFLLLHNHPSGDVSPSAADIETTVRCVEAGKLMTIPCLDHVIVGGGNGNYLSIREAGTVDFSNGKAFMTAEQILKVSEKDLGAYGSKAGKGKKKMADETKRNDVQYPDFVQEAEDMLAKEGDAQKRDEISIKFGRGLAEPFKSKDGNDFMRIYIPNQDPGDKNPWESFVLPAKAVHENQYGKGLWAKIPAEGTTTVTKPVKTGQDENGKNIWNDVKIQMPNKELKEKVEAYKNKAPQGRESETKESAREKLDALAKETSEKVSADKPKTKPKSKGNER